MKTIETYTFQKLNQMSDYKETAMLIYQTDPYIYKDLFGNIENACQILKFSFENPDCVFFKDSIYIVKNHHDEVIGCTLNHNNSFRWNQNVILSDFEKAEIEPPKSFFTASEYMDKTYNYRKIGSSICNVSVRSDYQRRGVASFLLKNILAQNKDGFFELTVLTSNIAAIKLYEKFGFMIVGDSFKDYGGYNLPPVDCYKMVCNGQKIR